MPKRKTYGSVWAAMVILFETDVSVFVHTGIVTEAELTNVILNISKRFDKREKKMNENARGRMNNL